MKDKEESEDEYNSSKDEMPALELIPVEELDLILTTKKSTGWPANMNLLDIILGIESNTFKWSRNRKDTPDEIILKMLKNNEVRLKNCWYVMDDANFKKLKNGFQEDITISDK